MKNYLIDIKSNVSHLKVLVRKVSLYTVYAEKQKLKSGKNTERLIKGKIPCLQPEQMFPLLLWPEWYVPVL